MSRSCVFSISDMTGVGDLRREAASLAREVEFNETQLGRLGIVVTEVGSNLAKHASGGMVLLRPVIEPPGRAIEVLAIDKGPGMADVAKCLEDGYSTAGSPGTGLGAIRRLSHTFDVFSQPGRGTILLARLAARAARSKSARWQFGAVSIPLHAAEPSGDAWSLRSESDSAQVLLADGLGHGELAARAADEAVRVFDEKEKSKPAQIVEAMHGPLRSTRGASLAVADISHEDRQIRYAGVGNISGVILSARAEGITSRSMVSHNGTVGLEMRTVREFIYPWAPSSVLVMHSDGLLTRWKLDEYPGLLARDPAIIAAVLLRDFQRGRDDASVVVMRQTFA